jgi:hypothetical protein
MSQERVVSVETLSQLQRTWTRLVMSGKPNGLAEKPGLLASLEQVGGEFNKLRGELLSALAESQGRETAVELGTRAQISIDILIRNLFERTADVGFLAEDGAIIDSLAALENAETDLDALRQRLDEYVAKYSVYDDIAVFRPNGALHVTRLGAASRFGADDPLVDAALGQAGSFREIFRHAADRTAQLLYVQTIPGPNRVPIGVLALSFKFDDEMRGIFGSLLKGAAPGLILGILDRDGRVLASSDTLGLGIGSHLNIQAEQLVTLTLGEADYLALKRPTRGYQGFFGLGWSGVALRPAALQVTEAQATESTEEHDERAIAGSAIVSDALKQISRRAYAIDSDLHLIGLNGKIAADRENNRVLPAVLASIREVGEQIRNAVHGVIGTLYDQTHGSLRREAEQMAALGVDIMDRNLYERANDNRWWALTPYFRTALAEGKPNTAEIGRILAYINGLYTVYSTLFVFDATGRVIADSRNGASGMVGEKLTGAHIEEALAGRNTQAYSVSAFEPTPLYDARPTYIYCGSILAPDLSRTVGGVAIVFDGAPQFRQMLLDVLPVDDSGAPYAGSFAAFVNAAGTIIASSDPAQAPGTKLDEAVLDGFQIVARGKSPGYREFKVSDGYSDPITCIVAIPG